MLFQWWLTEPWLFPIKSHRKLFSRSGLQRSLQHRLRLFNGLRLSLMISLSPPRPCFKVRFKLKPCIELWLRIRPSRPRLGLCGLRLWLSIRLRVTQLGWLRLRLTLMGWTGHPLQEISPSRLIGITGRTVPMPVDQDRGRCPRKDGQVRRQFSRIMCPLAIQPSNCADQTTVMGTATQHQEPHLTPTKPRQSIGNRHLSSCSLATLT